MVKLASPEAAAQTKKATRAALGATLAELADAGVPVVAVDADLTGSTTTKKLADAGHADRLFNCGIAEQNMVDVAAGLSLAGNVAFTGSFAVFGTGRAYDQIRNTVCYSNLNAGACPPTSPRPGPPSSWPPPPPARCTCAWAGPPCPASTTTMWSWRSAAPTCCARALT